MESYNRIKDGNGRLAQGKDEVRKIWKEYLEDLYNINTQEQVAVHMCGFDGSRRGYYCGGEPIRRAEIEVRVGKLKIGKDVITEEMIKGESDSVVDWIWRLCNMAFESGVVAEIVDLLQLFHCTRVKERGLNAKTIEVLT